MGEQDAWREQQNLESTSSSLEILRTLNISAAGDYQTYCDSAQDYKSMQMQMAEESLQDQDRQSLRCKHTESFLQKERVFIAQLIAKATEISPTIFDNGKKGPVDMNAYIVKGLRLLWSYVGIILDHILLWWIDNPVSCYRLTHIDSIRSWLYHQSYIRQPGHLSNQYFSNLEAHNNSSLLPVAEQIPILHRLDHSVHSMRLLVTEQAKLLCCEWKMERFFQILGARCQAVPECLHYLPTAQTHCRPERYTDVGLRCPAHQTHRRGQRQHRQAKEDASAQDTQLPSEMFVSNQKHWLQLRASGGNGFPFLKLCCGDIGM
ncbi:GM23627 [Drosophila sechellia]|uniref:GM23627 n=1 Tax=Drosophila sechellia TaxID=7238 RepID=B4HES4_DROSE|nr:GM23627 [Drosophila sechellia]